MRAAMRRKLHEYFEFCAAAHPVSVDLRDLEQEVFHMLNFPEQAELAMETLHSAGTRWMDARTAKPKPEQLPLPDFPHVPPMIKVGGGQHALAIMRCTVEEVEIYYEKIKARAKESGEQYKEELAELRKLLRMMKQAARTRPEITVEEVLARRARA